MELSLDEIIKKSKTGNGAVGGGITKKFTQKKNPIRNTRPIFKDSISRPIDARSKIVQNNRARIRDARDKLVAITRIKGDARRLIEKRRTVGPGPISTNGVHVSHRNGRYELTTRPVGPRPLSTNGLHVTHRNGRYELTTSRNFEPKPLAPRRNIRKFPNTLEIPRGYIDYDNMERMEQEEYNIARGLSRTVHNDVTTRMDTYSPPRAESIAAPPLVPRRLDSWGSQSSEHFDPFEIYEVPVTRRERRMSPTELPPPPPKGILRPSSRQRSPDSYQRRYIPESVSHLSYEMRSRLEHAPDPHASMGIFSNPLRGQSNMPAHSPNGYRIVVSNLHLTVTQSDIRELFEDIGELYDSRIVRPGVAEVIYKNLADAEKAVDTYHNRQLDRQPMKCLLVNPRASDKPTAPAIKTSSSSTRLAPGKTSLEIDIDALHKVLFRRH